MPPLPSQTEWTEWLDNPVTIAFRLALGKRIDIFRDGWENGTYTSDRADALLQLNAQAIGGVMAMRQMLTMEHEDLISMLSEEK